MENYTREKLIEICEKAIVNQSKWQNRDSASSQIGVGQCWALLKSGCKFQIATKENTIGSCITSEKTIWIQFWVKDFTWYDTLDGDSDEYPDGIDNSEYQFYLPTEKRLVNSKGEDWY
jgi:hypothetical protein